MSQTISKLSHQINLPKSLEIKEPFYSPTFSTNNDMFWQLVIRPKDTFYGVHLIPVAGPDEITWGERSKLSFKIYAREIKNSQVVELHTSDSYIAAPTDTNIAYGYGPTVLKKSSLRNGELIIIITFNNIEYKESEFNKNYSIEPIPRNLIEAWKDQLFDFQPADVEFNVQGEKFYASSSILSKRSEYFANLLSGKWAESMVVQKKKINQSESSNVGVILRLLFQLLFSILLFKLQREDDSAVTMQLNNNDLTNNVNDHIKHHIVISDCDPITFSIMLEYLYTNQVKWTIDEESITTKLFHLADKYLLSELRERAKIRIIDELNISNVSEIMFSLVPKYDDLKEPILNFMVKNLKEVSGSQEFKIILSNLVNYPNYDVILSEILAEHFTKIRLN